ncbi:DUF4365 domain-containing protein [Saccharothrix variisporea]|uniref:DUF4365 domain-containing protein n=1 Tax=Saccharothrix variisporea TaxID=543527 RepID=UPI0014774C3D|nr:DUF4365 domain-containing protein [Saccharothrix variisporea]
MLQEDVWQGHYGEGLVQALAHAAGLNTSKRVLDVDGVDINIGYPGRLLGRGYPCIEAQVKSWRSPVVNDGDLMYPLRVKNYNDLVGVPGVDFPVPRLLFLVTVPDVAGDYVQRCGQHYSFHHAIYWQSLMDAPMETVNHSTKTVPVPLANLVTVDSLLELLGRDFGAEAA